VRDIDPGAGRDRESAVEAAQEKVGKSTNAPVVLPFDATLAYVFRAAGGKETAINAARMLTETDERFKRFVLAYDSATERDKGNLILEDLCAAADIPPDEFLGLVIPALYRRNIDTGKLIAAVNHPKIVEATIQAAQGQYGMPDRKMLLDHAGFLPQSKGFQVNIDSRNQTLSIGSGGGKPGVEDTSLPGLPSFEQDAIEGTTALRKGLGQLRLKEATPEQSVEVPGEVLEGEFEDV